MPEARNRTNIWKPLEGNLQVKGKKYLNVGRNGTKCFLCLEEGGSHL